MDNGKSEKDRQLRPSPHFYVADIPLITAQVSSGTEFKHSDGKSILSVEGFGDSGAIIDHRSSIIDPDHRSSIIDHRSSIIDHRSSIIDHRSSIIDHRSSIFDLRSRDR